MRGPKPIPSRLKALRGNPGQRRLNAREPKIPPTVPTPPAWLGDEARKKWTEVAASLSQIGILTHVDADVLTLYCETWIEWKEATLAIRAHGLTVTTPTGDEKTSAYVLMRNKSLMQLRALAAELGLSPSSRSRVQTLNPSRRPANSKWGGMLTF